MNLSLFSIYIDIAMFALDGIFHLKFIFHFILHLNDLDFLFWVYISLCLYLH